MHPLLIPPRYGQRRLPQWLRWWRQYVWRDRGYCCASRAGATKKSHFCRCYFFEISIKIFIYKSGNRARTRKPLALHRWPSACARDPSAAGRSSTHADPNKLPIRYDPSQVLDRSYGAVSGTLVCVHVCNACTPTPWSLSRPLQPASYTYACLPLERARAYLQFIPPGGRARTKRGSPSIVSLSGWMYTYCRADMCT
jgi:hypothetical protein